VGRRAELNRLNGLLESVHQGGSTPGKAIALRGRRRVGKSRMVAEFVKQSKVPAVYFTAAHGTTDWELRRFADEVSRSTLPLKDMYQPGQSWEDALRALALILPRDSPSIVVLDEVPYLMREDRTFEGSLQAVWDRILSQLPVLLILVGSNRSEMERLSSYDRPFYMRGTEMELGPLSVNDVAQITGLSPADAIDAYLVTGGLPLILSEWKKGTSVQSFLKTAISNPLSALLVSGERAITAEIPAETNAPAILQSIGAGESSFTSIADTVGLPSTTLTRSLDDLANRRLVVVDRPLSTSASKNTHYRIEDPYLRFWLTFLADQIPAIEAGRAAAVLDTVNKRWLAWRGKAVEPVIRDLLWRSRNLVPESRIIGNWWKRNNSVEVDIVAGDRAPVAKTINYLGSIKWRDNAKFNATDLAELAAARATVPGAANAPMVAISRSGFDVKAPELQTISPEQLLTATA